MSWTGWMWLTVVTVLATPLGVAQPAAGVADERLPVVKVEPLVALARRAGLRVLAGRRLVLVTDRPERAGDGVADLPTIFDQAFTTWCDHYGLTAADTGDWQALGCLVVHRERFREAGLLPADIPSFANGFCDRNRFWLMDQSNPAYRRHLLLHEGVHAFTLTLRGLAAPVWYAEGTAEYLATHRLEREADGSPRFVATPIPDRPEDVEQLGRIEAIQELRATGRCPGLADVLAQPMADHSAIANYAASWAAVALLANHPATTADFARLQRGPLGPNLNDHLRALPAWNADRAARDFDAFTDGLDYGWDFSRMAIDWTAGPSLDGSEEFIVAANRGWQNSGCSLTAGQRYATTARGRVGLGSVVDEASKLITPLESEPAGISLKWYRGRPAGRLLVAQWGVDVPGTRPRLIVLAEGAAAEFTARFDGPVYITINGSPHGLAVNTGGYLVSLWPL